MLNIPRYKIAFLFFDMMIISIGIIIANYSVLNNSGLSALDQLHNLIELLFKLILFYTKFTEPTRHIRATRCGDTSRNFAMLTRFLEPVKR